MVKNIFFISILFFSFSAQAKLSAFIGMKTNFAGLGAARLGIDDWEVGQFIDGVYGANKRFKYSKNYYATFGIGLSNSNPAILSGFGFNFFRFLNFGLRGELYAVTSLNSNIKAAGTLGASWNY